MSDSVQEAAAFHYAASTLVQNYGTHLQRIVLELEAANKELQRIRKQAAEATTKMSELEASLSEAKKDIADRDERLKKLIEAGDELLEHGRAQPTA